MSATPTLPSGPEENSGSGFIESAKGREILDGARTVFRAQGYDGASMGEIARAAGVSKGTLYVYFESKAALFVALVRHDRGDAAERVFQDLDENDPDVAGALYRLGLSFAGVMMKPAHISLVRLLLGAVEKVPGIGESYFRTGPCYATGRLASFLGRQVEAGRLVIDDDLELAAAHFLNLCHGNMFKAVMFCAGDPPKEADVVKTVESAVRVFMTAYGAKPAGRRRRPATVRKG